MALKSEYKLEPWNTYKVTKTNGTELFVFNVPTSYSFVKYGRTDYVGKMPTHKIESGLVDRGDMLEEWPMSDEVFNDYYIDIIHDVFINTEYYVGKRQV